MSHSEFSNEASRPSASTNARAGASSRPSLPRSAMTFAPPSASRLPAIDSRGMIVSPASIGSQAGTPDRSHGAAPRTVTRDLAQDLLTARDRLGVRFGADLDGLLSHAAALTVEADVLRDAVQGSGWRGDAERRGARARKA